MYKEKKKTKKELRKLALDNRFKLGGMRYNKEYEPMINLAYKYDNKTLREMENKNSLKSKKISKQRNEIFAKLKKKGKNWSQELNSAMVDTSNNAEEGLNLNYARDLLKIFNNNK